LLIGVVLKEIPTSESWKTT